MSLKPRPLKGVFFKSGKYYLQRRVSPTVAAVIGKQNILVCLETDSLKLATERTPAAKRKVEAMIQKARDLAADNSKALEAQALEWRELFMKAGPITDEFDPEAEGAGIDAFVEEIESKYGEDRALELNNIARA